MDNMNFVFVYGTLKKDFCNHRCIESESTQFLGTATTLENFTMFDNGVFPALTLTPSYVIDGEVYAVDNHTFKRLDHLEGYHPSEPADRSHYLRKQIIVRMHLTDSAVTAWVYYQTGNAPKGMRRLSDGNYVNNYK